MKVFCAIGILLLSFGAASSWQQPPPQQPDPFAGQLFPPDLIMQHQQALNLSDDQKNFLKAELIKLQTRLTEVQWELQGEVEKLSALMKQDQVDEAQALAQLDKVLNLEREIKRAHIGLLIRLKNKLTSEQQARLREIVAKMPGR